MQDLLRPNTRLRLVVCLRIKGGYARPDTRVAADLKMEKEKEGCFLIKKLSGMKLIKGICSSRKGESPDDPLSASSPGETLAHADGRSAKNGTVQTPPQIFFLFA